jgi:predicted nucleic acid-binding protein
MGGLLFDTSVYVDAFRAGGLVKLKSFVEGQPVWLSSVVLEELYAGVEGEDVAVLEKLEHSFERVARILVPNVNDWISTGKALAFLHAEFDCEVVGRGRITNDALIAMSAGRSGLTLITHNEKDFARLAKFRRFNWRLSTA